MSVELTTVTGKPLSVGTGLRLPITTYQRAKDRAKRDDVKLNRLLCDLIIDGLDRHQEKAAEDDN